mmetsp:Transcript_7007/g.11768  ORF Transcript_7007/g.11768 Transcript_7007/m.11768 type:complete len:129 (+) Transcript_7007:187-573(+)
MQGIASSNTESFEMVPRVGDMVHGRVNKVEDRFARVEILAIENRPLQGRNSHFTGVIFKENVRNYDRDNVQMHQCFVPNDIIQGRVIQEASGSGQSVQISTLEDEMGVKFAWSSQSGKLMVPRNWTEF